MYAHSVLLDRRPMFSQSHMSLCRQHVVLSIMKNSLSNMLDNQQLPNHYKRYDDDDSSSSVDSSSSDERMLNYNVWGKPPTEHKPVAVAVAHHHKHSPDPEANTSSPEKSRDTVRSRTHDDCEESRGRVRSRTHDSEEITISDPSHINFERISDTVGGKPSISSYNHYAGTKMIDGEKYIKYENFVNKKFSVSVSSSTLAGKIIVGHDGNKLSHAKFAHQFKKRGAWFVDLITKASDFPNHISLRSQRSRAVALNQGRGNKAKHPYILYFSGWCSGRSGRTNDNDCLCTTKYVGGFDVENLRRAAMNPVDARVTISILITGQCIHQKNARFGQLRGPARQRQLHEVSI